MSGYNNEETVQMRCALSAIADEVQRFYKESLSSTEANEKSLDNEDILSKALMQCKSTIKLKQEHIRTLRQHLKTVCSVVKTLSAAKESETKALNDKLNNTRNQYWEVVKQQEEKNKRIKILRTENETIRNKCQCFKNLIKRGYEELQNKFSEKFEDISSQKQLEKIIFYCGKYYADYSNQREKCIQLEQKNKFLNSKIRIVESYLETSSNELQNLRNNGVRLRRGKTSLIKVRSNLSAVLSESLIGRNNNTTIRATDYDKASLIRNMKSVDLACHLSTVKNLLHDQDVLLKDLKCLSREINVPSVIYGQKHL